MYLSGQPLHVITLTLADAFRGAVGPGMPISFSAGVDRFNFTDMVACGFCPITVCTDLLRPGGYGRLPVYLKTLAAAMGKAGASNVDEYILNACKGAPETPAGGAQVGPESQHTTDEPATAAARNLSILAQRAQANPRYRAENNRKVPKRIDSELDTFDCITCDKCIPVCPNAANFLFTTAAESVRFHDWVARGDSLVAGEAREIAVERTAQIANFADFCNDCGNCDTLCPEYGGPFIKKPNFFGTFAGWQSASRDGFFIDHGPGRGATASGRVPLSASTIHGRIKGRTYRLTTEPHWRGYRYEDGTVCLFLRAADHAVKAWFAFGPRDPAGHVIDMDAYHTMRILMTSLTGLDRIHQVNVGLAARRLQIT
jgi:putative selenate reductase